MDEARSGAGSAAYRGFLFSDMRGFTAFAERHGNAAAADAVRKFLDIARTAIARHQGAELKTEGDAIHAVFPSASSAVLCGLDIIDRAAELNAREPERPLRLGVGVHAGEAVETAEGYIGRAVNIAARLCAAAQPGEVLVSSTVKGITQASIPVGFVPRGRKRLKGIEDPVLVYAVHHADRPAPPAQMPRPAIAGAIAAGVVALAVIAAIGASLLGGQATTTPSPAAVATPTTPAAQPVAMGPLGIGTYATRQFEPAMQFQILDLDWSANRDVPEMLGLIRDDVPRGSVSFMRVSEVVENPCIAGGEGNTGEERDDVVARLFGLTHFRLTNLQSVNVDGAKGRQVDVTVDEAALAACGGLAGDDVAVFIVGTEEWRAAPGERFRIIAITVGEEPVTIAISTDWAQTSSVQELEDLYRQAQRIIDSVDFLG